MNKKSALRRALMIESSTADGATLYAVLIPLTAEATIDDVLVEIANERDLINLILGMSSEDERAGLKLFVNKNAAMDLANTRIALQDRGARKAGG